VFAFTPTVNPAVHHEWGTGAILYLVSVESGLGIYGLSILRLLLIAGIWLFLYRIARMRGAHPYVFASVAVATFPVFWVGFSMVRAQLFTLLFLAAQMWMQELDWRGKRGWTIAWWLMLVVWLNLHAGFVVGIGMLGFHSLERFGLTWYRTLSLKRTFSKTWHLFLLWSFIPLAMPINPYGWSYFPYLMEAITMERPLIREWQMLWHTHMPFIAVPAFLVSVFIFAYCQRHIRVSRMRGAAFLALCAFEALKHIRHGSIYGLVWLAYVPAWISRIPLGKTIISGVQSHRIGAIRCSQCLSLGCLVFAMINHFWQPTLPTSPKTSILCFPEGVVQYLDQSGFRGNLLTPFHHGAYVSWTLFPKVLVSLDGRYEVAYEPQVMDEHYRLFNGRCDWPELLEKYPCDAVLVEQESRLRPLLDVFQYVENGQPPPTKGKWKIVYEDDAFAVLANDRCNLPEVDQRGRPIPEGLNDPFGKRFSHRNRSRLTREHAARFFPQ
jgi:hypothetical protein